MDVNPATLRSRGKTPTVETYMHVDSSSHYFSREVCIYHIHTRLPQLLFITAVRNFSQFEFFVSE